MDSKDKKKAASDLRAQAAKLERDARKLRLAAQVLDPSIVANPITALLLKQNQKDIILRLLAKSAMNLAEKALREKGDGLTREELFEYVQKSGSKVTSLAGFAASLSRDKRFVYEGRGEWALAEWQIQPEPDDPND
ncbi:MAG TPA: hypothetical protein VK737_07080 [Opitutales bacterium]|jgi:hypothetical protein|nr:hypothetical protein [Opitutales bacterium]